MGGRQSTESNVVSATFMTCESLLPLDAANDERYREFVEHFQACWNRLLVGMPSTLHVPRSIRKIVFSPFSHRPLSAPSSTQSLPIVLGCVPSCNMPRASGPYAYPSLLSRPTSPSLCPGQVLVLRRRRLVLLDEQALLLLDHPPSSPISSSSHVY